MKNENLPYWDVTNRSALMAYCPWTPNGHVDRNVARYGCDSAEGRSRQPATYWYTHSIGMAHGQLHGPYKGGGRSRDPGNATPRLSKPLRHALSHSDHYPRSYSTFSTMSTSHATASFYPTSAIPTEIPVFDPELQRLIDELDHLDTLLSHSILIAEPKSRMRVDPFALGADDEGYLSLYDLCGGDPTLVDTIIWANLGPSITSSATPPLVPATPSPKSDYFDFPTS
jgi:hypothetical protein